MCSAQPERVASLTTKDFRAAFQPIVCLSSGETLGQEVLARCLQDQFKNPLYLFAAAAQQKACGRLGRIVREVAVRKSPKINLFLNIHPQELSQRWLVRPDDPMCLHEGRLYLEITESAAFRHFELSMQVLAEVRERVDARIVVDDFGVEYSNFERVLALNPEIVKLDKTLVRGVHTSTQRQVRVERLIALCHQTGARVVTEGIEEEDELNAVINCGADLGQGYLLGRPAFTPVCGELPPQSCPSPSQETTVFTSPDTSTSQETTGASDALVESQHTRDSRRAAS